ncbi:hypothetical protein LPJ71_005733, partial [Coemansia sp. S17]
QSRRYSQVAAMRSQFTQTPRSAQTASSLMTPWGTTYSSRCKPTRSPSPRRP